MAAWPNTLLNKNLLKDNKMSEAQKEIAEAEERLSGIYEQHGIQVDASGNVIAPPNWKNI